MMTKGIFRFNYAAAYLLSVAGIFAVLLGLVLVAHGCTANQRAKKFGGTYQVKLPCGQKLRFATWKEANLWYATRPFRDGEKPETTTMREDSEYGVVQGKVVFVECAKE